ncbi:unnamed protein product [Hermetia illucens]|uniref:Uncharacterized protein n=1 Tax=Hermetia illucens TaxID=343691 RepID=A0A7R8YR31_HERIL|nr:hexamerin-1.1-like [Hermetia illucens]CAD7081075.1 unnamed protein product [Hermetia illucens]
MKSLVVLAFCLASAAAVLDSVWDQLHGYGVGGARTGWTGGRLMGDTGLDDDVHFSKYRNLYDVGTVDTVDKLGWGLHTGYPGIGKVGLKTVDDVRTVDNMDKKYVKYDDDVKLKILGDKHLLLKQKFILDVLMDVHKPLHVDDVTHNVHIVEEEIYYKNFDKVIDFFRLLKNKNVILPRGTVFTVTNKLHRNQMKLLFHLFYYSKDFIVFQKNVLWARQFINEELFVHALIAAVLHRDDMVGVKVPALYEILPYKFHTSMTIDKALKLKDITVVDKKDLVIFNKYTKDYMTMNDEGKLAYLMEDIGWNLYHYFMYMDFASWIGGKDFNLFKERRGEKYLYFIQQILARYNLERLSNGLGHIKDISLWDYIKTGYNPMMVYKNGLPVTVRKNYYDIRETGDYFLMKRVDDYARRIRDAIDQGYSITIDGGKVDLKRSDAIDILGNMIQWNIDSVNKRYYGSLIIDFVKLLGGGYVKNVDDFKLTPSVVDHYETALRDPVIYQLYKKIMKMVYMFKDYLPTYTKTDLLFDAVHVDNIRTTKLITYFDLFDVDLRTMINLDSLKTKDVHLGDDRVGKMDKLVVARHMRLNHKPFTINIDLTVDRPEKVVIRTFLGPKFDADGKILKIKYNRDNFVELDKFTYDLTTVGKVTIKRDSRDFVYTVKDRTSIMDIYKLVLLNGDVNKLVDMHVDEANCGFPDRLVLPKGWVGGMPMQLFVIVTKAKDVVKRDFDHTIICGKRTLINEVDDFSLGFPFDRRIDETEFYTKNMLFKDVLIFHDDDTNLVLNALDVGGTVKDVGVLPRTVGVWDTHDTFADTRNTLTDTTNIMDMMRMKMTMV